LVRGFNGVTLIGVTVAGEGGQIWRSDGTPAGAALIAADLPPWPAPSENAPVRDRWTAGQNFFFAASDPSMERELFALSNDLPLGAPDSASSSSGAAVTIDVLANDSDRP